jgi:deoxyhypusine monooxygenase
LFVLKNINSVESRQIIQQAFHTKSNLLKHELAYCLGQMGHTDSLPTLHSILEDSTQHSMVRHEAAEAMGAIGSSSSLDILRKYSSECCQVVSETCLLAIDSILNKVVEKDGKAVGNDKRLFTSTDPAPGVLTASSTLELETILMDQSKSLYDRYKAMFTLRNRFELI